MIASHDRSGWFGASDTDKVTAKNRDTKTWRTWYAEKLGISRNDFTTGAMLAGTYFEHRILDALSVPGIVYDRQVFIEDLRLRVNLDGDTGDCIYEVKTHSAEKVFKCPKKYINQVLVQMFATGMKKAYIVSYGLEDEDYRNYLRPISLERLELIPVEYDEEWICCTYLPKIRELSDALKKGVWP